jgi:integrase
MYYTVSCQVDTLSVDPAGVPFGELQGLAWSDIDFDGGHVLVPDKRRTRAAEDRSGHELYRSASELISARHPALVRRLRDVVMQSYFRRAIAGYR